MDFQLPILKDVDLYPSPISPVPFTFIRGGEADRAAALTIVHQHIALINQFVNRNRRNYSLGGPPVFKQMKTIPGLIMTYINQFGQEKLILEPNPKFVPIEEPKGIYFEDIMYDGYIYIYLIYPIGPVSLNPNITQPNIDVFLNGQFIGTKGRDIYPKDFSGGANPFASGFNNDILITFGGDALHAHSWNDKNNEFKKHLLPLPSPGPPVDKQKNKLKPFYYPYGFLNPYKFIKQHDPSVFLNEDVDVIEFDPLVTPLPFGAIPRYPKPQIVLRRHFPNIKTSPLKPTGLNNLTLQVSEMPHFFNGFSQDEARYRCNIYAEFFSRDPRDFRKVYQSWHYIDLHGHLSIIVNDRPKQWRMAAQDNLPTVLTTFGGDVLFALFTPKFTKGPNVVIYATAGGAFPFASLSNDFLDQYAAIVVGFNSYGTDFPSWPAHTLTSFLFDLSPKNPNPLYKGEDCLPPPKQ